MKYRLYDNAYNNIANTSPSNIARQFLVNRGVKDWQQYLHLDHGLPIYNTLDNMDKAVDLFMKHFDHRDKISILVDSDPDGYCSAAMMYLYIKRLDRDYPVYYVLHTRAKAHGLSDVTIPDDTKLLIIPDAGTNDAKECEELSHHMDIIILDHHESEVENHYAVIVNNQMSKDYPNKELCGAGVVYKFLLELDAYNFEEMADDYLDLCALANISDVMDMRSFETRYLTNEGLKNIKNKCLKAFIDAQDYAMHGKVNIHNIQWYITPLLNGCIRMGTQEEKELLFRAFIETDEQFEYKKRATKDSPSEIIQESIYDRAVRLCKNAKTRQDKQREKSLPQIVDKVQHNSADDKVIMVDVSDVLDGGLTGVVAIKIAEMFRKPCILFRKFDSDKYGGSARNFNNSPVESFKDVVNDTGIFKGVGHANAFGVIGLTDNNKDAALNRLNNILKDIEYDLTYKVDFIFEDIDDIDVSFIYDLSKLQDLVAQGLEEPMIAIENISLTRDCFEVFGKNEDTISFTYDDIKYIQFKCKEGNGVYDFLQDAWSDDDQITFNIVGHPSLNDYNGVITPQIIIEDNEVLGTSETDKDDSDDDDFEW